MATIIRVVLLADTHGPRDFLGDYTHHIGGLLYEVICVYDPDAEVRFLLPPHGIDPRAQAPPHSQEGLAQAMYQCVMKMKPLVLVIFMGGNDLEANHETGHFTGRMLCEVADHFLGSWYHNFCCRHTT